MYFIKLVLRFHEQQSHQKSKKIISGKYIWKPTRQSGMTA